jgi:hypothetical protein
MADEEPASEARSEAKPSGGGGAGYARPVTARPDSAAQALLLFAVFAAVSLLVYRAALHGPFLSDDFGYIVANPYTSGLRWENLRAIFDPFGPARLYTANYAPVHLLLTAFERQIFADHPFGYHVVNLLLHAANASLLVALLRASGLPLAGALAGGAVFLLHPANVEAVAWISQLKSVAALTLAFGALLLHPGRPAAAAALFALALLTKASAAFAWPMACALAWARRGRARAEGRWLALWGLLLVLFALPEYASFAGAGEAESTAFASAGEQLRTIAAIGTRYLLMAATSLGVAAFQEPAPARSWLDPRWLVAIPLAAVLVWRTASTLRARQPEAAWWIGAAAAWAPVSQIFPFLNPIADRYLYFMLPGLIGGTSLWLGSALRQASLRRAAVALAAALAAVFALGSAERARLWRDEALLLLDAARHYPDGATAHYLNARRAANQGEAAVAVAELREAWGRGLDRFMAFDQDPALAGVRDTPEFRELIREMAGAWLERARQRGHGTPAELLVMAQAHVARGEFAPAAALLEQGLAAGGPFEDVLRAELAAVRLQERGAGSGDSFPPSEETGHLPPGT